MIVQCPSCASRYRIRDSNIPPSGGKIRCPSCSHSFVVYPEGAQPSAPPAQPDDDRTSITSQNQISNLVGRMEDQRPSDEDEDDYVATQIASGELDKLRAMHALQQELGDPSDMDGTVEIQNPMKLWQEAQAAQAARNASAEVLDESADEFDLKTEIADASRFHALDRRGDDRSLLEQSDPTFLMPQPQNGADAFGDSSPGMDPSGLGSGVHPYAQNTPPGGRAPGPGGFPGQGSGFNSGPAFNRGHSPSGLHSAQLFDDSEAEETSLQ